jgi:ubiquinone/menaquinone biosynthesis C-methylase UbiE
MLEINKSKTIRDSNFLKDRKSDIVGKIEPYLKKTDRILDIGCGGAHVAKTLKDAGYHITPLDIRNKSYFKDIQPVIYDGKKIPFADNSFDIALLLTVLHHIKDPLATLAEAKRVSKRIIIIEDLHVGWLQKYLTFAMDSFLNREFFGHPHTNKTEEEWEAVFRKMGLNILDRKKNNFWHFFTSGTFYLQKGL